MLDPELVVQLTADTAQEMIFACRVWHHQMRGQGDFGGAHAPDMQVVDIHDARQRAQVRFNRRELNVLRHRIQRQVHTIP